MTSPETDTVAAKPNFLSTARMRAATSAAAGCVGYCAVKVHSRLVLLP
jgi:hypothetical protein